MVAIEPYQGAITSGDRIRQFEDAIPSSVLATKGVMDTIYPWWFDEREFPRRAVMTEWFYNPLKGQPRYIDVYRTRALAASEYVRMCVMTLIEEVASVEWEIIPKDPDLVESPPEALQVQIDRVTDFLDNPNDNKGEDIHTIFRAAINDSLEIDALNLVKGFSLSSYERHPAGGYELKPPGQRELVELFARDGGSMLKEADVGGIEYRYWQYSYLHPAVAPIEFDVNEIVYGMRYPRSYSVYGWSEVQSAETILNLLINSAFTNASMFQEYSVPSGIVSFTGSEEDETRLREYFRTEVKGHFHKVAILNKEAQFTPMAMSSRDLEFINGQRWFLRLMWALYKITPTELGWQDEIRETGKAMGAQGKIQKRKGVMPLLKLLERAMNRQVIFEFEDPRINDWLLNSGRRPGLKFQFKYVDREEEMAEDQLAVELQNAGFMTPNEYRKRKKQVTGGTWYEQFGDQPFPYTLAQLKGGGGMRGQGGGFQTPASAGPVGQPGKEALRQAVEEEKEGVLPAEGRSLAEALKTWGGRSHMSWDFADKSDYATPVLTYDSTGKVRQVTDFSHRADQETLKELKAMGRIPYSDTDIIMKGKSLSGMVSSHPYDKAFRDLKRKYPRLPDTEIHKALEPLAQRLAKQYARPERSGGKVHARPSIGPYAGTHVPSQYPMTAVGNRPDEPIRRGELLGHENAEEIQRRREQGEVLPVGGLGEEHPGTHSAEEWGDVTRSDPRLGPASQSGTHAHRWERDETHGHGNVPTSMGPNLTESQRTDRGPGGSSGKHPRVGDEDPELGDNQTPRKRKGLDRLAPRRNVTDATTDPQQYRGFESPGYTPQEPTPEQHAHGPTEPVPKLPLAGAQPGVDPTKRPYPQGPRNIGAMGADRRASRKMVLEEPRGPPPSESTGALGPDHRETLGYTERQGKIRDGVKRSAWAQKAFLNPDMKGEYVASFDLAGREKFAKRLKHAEYVERPEFKFADTRLGHYCNTCPYMKQEPKSPTSFWCVKVKAPDQPWGCCRYWKMKPELRTQVKAHGHAPAFSEVVIQERGLNRQLSAIVQGVYEGRIAKPEALKQGLATINRYHDKLLDIARKRLLTKRTVTLPPEVSERLDSDRQEGLKSFSTIMGDTQQ